MQGLIKALNRLLLRVLFKPFLGPPFSFGFQRRWIGLLSGIVPGPKGAETTWLEAGEVSVARIRCRPEGAPPAGATEDRDAILMIHGGGFVLGGARTHGALAAWVALLADADVYLPEYRLAPEHPHPAAVDDLFAAYRVLLERGHAPERVAILGDSAGGALAVETVLTLPEMDVPSPAALVLISPWLDLTLSGASVAAVGRRDPLIRRAWLEQAGRAHAGPLRRSDPRVSPLFADPAGLPPILIQVGSDEILLDDSVRFADRAWAGGVEVELQRFEGWWHDFQTSAATLKASREAIEDIAAFLARRFRG